MESSFEIERINPFKIINQRDVPHRHAFYEIFIFDKGGGSHLIDFNNYPIVDNSVQIISPGQLHHVLRERHSSGYVIRFKHSYIFGSTQLKSFFDQINYNVEFSPSITATKEILDLSLRLIESYESKTTSSEHNALSLLHLLIGELYSKQNHLQIQKATDQTLFSSFLQLVEQHFLTEKSTEFYVGKLATNASKLNQASKTRTGISAKQFLIERVTLEAKRLLYEDKLSIKEISFELNFQEPAHFTNFIKKQTSLSPGELKKELIQ